MYKLYYSRKVFALLNDHPSYKTTYGGTVLHSNFHCWILLTHHLCLVKSVFKTWLVSFIHLWVSVFFYYYLFIYFVLFIYSDSDTILILIYLFSYLFITKIPVNFMPA